MAKKIFVAMVLFALLMGTWQKQKYETNREFEDEYDDEIEEEEEDFEDVLKESFAPLLNSIQKQVSPPAPKEESTLDVLIDEKIKFTDSVAVFSNHWEEIRTYTRHFELKKDYSRCGVTISIPYVGNSEEVARNRIMLTWDEEPIYDSTMHSLLRMNLITVDIAAHKNNPKSGFHFIKLYGATDKGVLFIPYYSQKKYDAFLSPSLFATLEVFCQI